jgi:flavin reductase (DIM6/NTAB) family NADH-FMN oxidoreductase RutF
MQNNNLGVAMKLGMRRLASGVCILSACADNGESFAMTVSSVTSVSDNPASLLVCINKLVSQHAYLSTLGNHFAINALNSNQQDLSNLCAGREQGRNRFSLGDWQRDENGVPYLTDAQAVFFCQADMVAEYGTHHIVVGKIHQVLVGEDGVNPLLYVDGRYGLLAQS